MPQVPDETGRNRIMERILVGLFLALSVFYVANEAAMTAKVIRNHIRLVKA